MKSFDKYYILFKRQCKYSKQGHPYIIPPKLLGIFTALEDAQAAAKDIKEPVESFECSNGATIDTDYMIQPIQPNMLYINGIILK